MVGGSAPKIRSVTRLNCISLFSTRSKIDNFYAKKNTFVSLFFSKILVARLAAFSAADRVFKRLRQGCNIGGGGGSQEGRCPPNKNFARINPKATVGENIGSRGGVEDTRLEAKDPKKSNAKA